MPQNNPINGPPQPFSKAPEEVWPKETVESFRKETDLHYAEIRKREFQTFCDEQIKDHNSRAQWAESIGLGIHAKNSIANETPTLDTMNYVARSYGYGDVSQIVRTKYKKRTIQKYVIERSRQMRLGTEADENQVEIAKKVLGLVEPPAFSELRFNDDWAAYLTRQKSKLNSEFVTDTNVELAADWYFVRENLFGFEQKLLTGLRRIGAIDSKFAQPTESVPVSKKTKVAIATTLNLYRAFSRASAEMNTLDIEPFEVAAKSLGVGGRKRKKKQEAIERMASEIELDVGDFVPPRYGVAHLLMRNPLTKEACLDALRE